MPNFVQTITHCETYVGLDPPFIEECAIHSSVVQNRSTLSDEMDYIIVRESQRSVQHLGEMTDPRHGRQYTITRV